MLLEPAVDLPENNFEVLSHNESISNDASDNQRGQLLINNFDNIYDDCCENYLY